MRILFLRNKKMGIIWVNPFSMICVYVDYGFNFRSKL